MDDDGGGAVSPGDRAVFGWKAPKTLSFRGFGAPTTQRISAGKAFPFQTFTQQAGQQGQGKPNFIESAKSHPGVQKLVGGVNDWEVQVRNAQKRIAMSLEEGMQAAGKRVKDQRPAPSNAEKRRGFPPFAEESQLIQKVEKLSTGFKRSISEGDFLGLAQKKRTSEPESTSPHVRGSPPRGSAPKGMPGMRRVTTDTALDKMNGSEGQVQPSTSPIKRVGSWIQDIQQQGTSPQKQGEQARKALLQYQEQAKRQAAAVQQYIRGALPLSPGEKGAAARDEAGEGGGALAPAHLWPSLPGVQEGAEELPLFQALAEKRKRLRKFREEGGGGRKKGARRSLRGEDRKFAIVTTAALPWMTGTAVNPLLRAAYLSQMKKNVTLLVPWLCREDQERVYPNKMTFETPEQQEVYVRDWVSKRVGFQPDFKLQFYAGRYAQEKGSILPVGDLTSYIPDGDADVAVLEEPEHLNWYHHGRRWTDKFQHVVGIVHTNYLEYAKREEHGDLKEKILRGVTSWMCRSYCHKVVKLSGAVQEIPRSVIEYVHGVSPTFLDVGDKKAREASEGRVAAAAGGSPGRGRRGKDKSAAGGGDGTFKGGCYFLGKVVWAKGYAELLDMMRQHCDKHGVSVPVDVYGSGPDAEEVETRSQQHQLPLKFHGALDHANERIHDYRVFVNPSLSDVVATTTAEALAMGKWVVVAEHPSNDFFSTFPNCLVYRTPDEFSSCLHRAMREEPSPLRPEDRHRLTWEAATERFLESAEADGPKPWLPERMADSALAGFHQVLSGAEAFRVVAGAGAGTKSTPKNVVDYHNIGGETGFLDRKPAPPKVSQKST